MHSRSLPELRLIGLNAAGQYCSVDITQYARSAGCNKAFAFISLSETTSHLFPVATILIFVNSAASALSSIPQATASRLPPLFVPNFRYCIHRVSKNVPPLACYNFDTHEWILIFFDRNVTDKAGNQKTLYYATLSNLYFCTTWQNWETRKSHFHSVGLCYTQSTYALSS